LGLSVVDEHQQTRFFSAILTSGDLNF